MTYADLMKSFSEASVSGLEASQADFSPSSYLAGYDLLLGQLPVEFLKKTEACDPTFTDFPSDYDPNLAKAFGIPSLYSHQREALDAVRKGSNIVIKTPTASGKTNAFNAPIIEGILKRDKTALYIYPLKALADDQVEKIEELNSRLPGRKLKVCVLTGDISMADRLASVNSNPDIIVVSPDVLHHQLYKQRKTDWESWSRFLKRLAYVVVDEAHTYTGSFGSNVSHLLSRLKICVDFCSGDSESLNWLVATATIGNPVQFSSLLTGCAESSFTLIEKSGAGSRGRTFASLKTNDGEHDIYHHLEKILRVCQSSQVPLRGIIFANTRGEVKAYQSMIARKFGKISAAYYGGLRSNSRHNTIEDLKSGRIDWIVSTSALEAGVDLPSVDIAVCVGFAGSIMSHNQRVGRAGRKNPALVLFCPKADDSLDNYYSADPSRLFGKPESGLLSPEYPVFLAQHISCCAVESAPRVTQIEQHFGASGSKVANFLLGNQKVKRRGDCITSQGYPHMGGFPSRR